MGFWGPVIKEGLILVISIVTLQNYFGDPRMGENTGTFWYLPLLDPAHYSTYVFGGGGGVIKEGLILVISIATLQHYFDDLGEVCGKYPGWVQLHQLWANFLYILFTCVGKKYIGLSCTERNDYYIIMEYVDKICRCRSCYNMLASHNV